MDRGKGRDLLAAIDQLERHMPSSPLEAERLMANILDALLGEEGYEVHDVGWSGDRGFEYVAHRDADDRYSGNSLGVQFRYRRAPSSVSDVRGLLGAAVLTRFDRAVLLASAGFTKSARQLINRELPIAVELIDTATLRDWVQRLVSDDHATLGDVRSAVRTLSRALALIIARDPKELRAIEWRDLERLLAEAFDGLGFSVVLTPPAKDGGKDIVLTCRVMGKERTYIVEAKHWIAGGKVGTATVYPTKRVKLKCGERRAASASGREPRPRS